MNEEYDAKLKKSHQSWVQDYRIYLIKFLEDELFIMDQEGAAAQVDDAEDGDDDSDDEESEDEGYITDEDHGNDHEDDHINFGLAPMLMNILV